MLTETDAITVLHWRKAVHASPKLRFEGFCYCEASRINGTVIKMAAGRHNTFGEINVSLLRLCSTHMSNYLDGQNASLKYSDTYKTRNIE